LGTLDTFAISRFMIGQRSPGGTADHSAERFGLSFGSPDRLVSPLEKPRFSQMREGVNQPSGVNYAIQAHRTGWADCRDHHSFKS
jgi:hypothetical protein